MICIHEIGCEFARRFLADRFECTVSTHLDKGHLHNHIVVNSVSYADGKMFRNNFVSSIALHTREKLIEVMESDYVLFARARGESDWSILRRHGLRNILLPAMTLQFASVSEIIGGSVLVEQVFSYPGLGQAAVTAGLGSDVPLLLGITVVTAVIVAAGNLAANVLYGVIDPRIREGAKR